MYLGGGGGGEGGIRTWFKIRVRGGQIIPPEKFIFFAKMTPFYTNSRKISPDNSLTISPIAPMTLMSPFLSENQISFYGKWESQ